VITTARLPYDVCGAQQDSSTVCVPSTTNEAGRPRGRRRTRRRWRRRRSGRRRRGGGAGTQPATYSPGGAEPAFIAPDPKDPDVFFSGGNNGSFLVYTNRRTGQSREVHPYPRMFSGEPSSALVERVQWTFPIVFSPVDPNILYTATQHLWKTTNNGTDWTRISGDLTKHDPEDDGSFRWSDHGRHERPEVYATIFTIAPSKVDVNVIWTGSDDGVISVTRDGGKTWSPVTPPNMPELGRVSIIDASAFDAGTAYAAVKRMLNGDEAPYLFRTHDYGKTWTKIVNGLKPTTTRTRSRKTESARELLYAGTQHAIYYSYDDGDTWHSLSLNLPDTQISDIWVEDTDLTIARTGAGSTSLMTSARSGSSDRRLRLPATWCCLRRRIRSGRIATRRFGTGSRSRRRPRRSRSSIPRGRWYGRSTAAARRLRR
jgi:hypothetical protein